MKLGSHSSPSLLHWHVPGVHHLTRDSSTSGLASSRAVGPRVCTSCLQLYRVISGIAVALDMQASLGWTSVLPPCQALLRGCLTVPHCEPRHANGKEVTPKFSFLMLWCLGCVHRPQCISFSSLLFSCPSPQLLEPRGPRAALSDGWL